MKRSLPPRPEDILLGDCTTLGQTARRGLVLLGGGSRGCQGGWGYLAGELAGEAVLPLPSFSRALTSCTLPPVASHSTLSSSTRRFWWHVLASSLNVNAGGGHRQRGPKKPSCLAPGRGAQSPV